MTSTKHNLDLFYAAQASMSSATPETITGASIHKFANSYNNQNSKRIPLHVRTGAQAFGAPGERKRFKQIEFHGTGTLSVRVYVDNVWISDGFVTLSETPNKDRRYGLPVGTKGYYLDLEFAGDANIRAIEYEISSMDSSS